MTNAKVDVGDVLHDWTRGDRVVVAVIRPEDLHRYTDGRWRRGSTAETCALHGGRRQRFEVRD